MSFLKRLVCRQAVSKNARRAQVLAPAVERKVFLTLSICRSSKVMSRCAALAREEIACRLPASYYGGLGRK